MDQQLPARLKRQLFKSSLQQCIGLALLVTPMCWLTYYTCLCIAYQSGVEAAVCIAMTALCFYLFVPVITGACLQIYLNRHILKRDYNRIDSVYSKGISLLRRLPVQRNYYTANLLSTLARMKRYQGDYDSAESLYLEALACAKKDWRWALTPATAIHHLNVSNVYFRRQKYVEAESEIEQALSLLSRSRAPEVTVITALAKAAIGAIKLELGDLQKAEELLTEALTLIAAGQAHAGIPESSIRHTLSSCYLRLGLLYIRTGERERSQSFCDRFLAGAQNDPSTVDTLQLLPMNLLASEYLNESILDRAERLLELSYSVGRDFPLHPDSPATLASFERLLLLTDRGKDIDDLHHWLLPLRHQ